MIFSIIAYAALFGALVSMFLAIKGRHQYYWISALCIYIFSFLAGFSIGLFTVGFTFIPLALAIGHTFGWVNNKIHSLVFVCLGIAIGFLTVLFVDDALLFFPFWFLF